MTVKGGPKIETDGLVFHLDAAAASIGKSYPIDGLDVEYLVVAGGGGGGGSPHGAGGGAGGLLTGTAKATISTGTYSIVIGAGGAGKVGTKTSPWPSPGTNYGANGGNSTAFGKTALGGGGGGGYSYCCQNDTIGRDGGSGGGTGRDPSSVGQATQPSSSDGGYGNNGGRGAYALNNQYNHAGGGGGAGGPGYLIGSTLDTSKVSFGGIGKYFGDKYSTNVGEDGWFSGGGGGSYYIGANLNRDNQGLGGGGRGGWNTSDPDPGNGLANTGGGGGGAERSSASDATGGDGGSGIVLIRYKGSQKASGGDSIIKHRGYTVHVFTSSGNFVVGDRVGGTSRNKIVGELKNMDNTNYKNGNKGYWNLATDEYIDLSSAISGDHKTIIIWAYINSNLIGDTTGWKGPVLSNTGSTGECVWIGSFTSYFSGEVLNIYSGAARYTSYLGNISQGWHNFVFAWNGTSYDIYIDGLQKTTTPGANGHCLLLNSKFAKIGYRDCCSQYFTGGVAVVQLYTSTLPTEQILDIYNATKGRFGL